MPWMVMAGVEYSSANPTGKTSFERNATDLPCEGAAKIEAERRNEVERKAGNAGVLWFPCEQLDFAAMFAGMRQ